MLKSFKAEQKAVEYIKKNVIYIAIFVFVLISVVIRLSGINYESGDYGRYLKPWFEQIKSEGGFASLKHTIGDYNIPYVFILTALTYLPFKPILMIKLVSIIFDYACAFVSAAIVYRLLQKTEQAIFATLVTFSIMLFLPTLLLNSAFWAQSDSIYTAFVLLCVLFLIEEKYIPAFVFFSVAFTFKLQAIFILPVLIILYFVKNKFSVLHFLIPPIIFFLSITPALIAGRSFTETVKIYVNQAGEYQYLYLNYPNLYAFFKGDYKLFVVFGILLTVAVLGLIALYIIHKGYNISNSNIVSVTILLIYICLFFLPAMHERYGIVIDILSVIYYVVKRKKIYIPIIINFVSLIAYTKFLFGQDVLNDSFLALGNLAALVILTFDVFADLKKEQEMKKADTEENAETVQQAA